MTSRSGEPPLPPGPASDTSFGVLGFRDGAFHRGEDRVVVEEPLEIRVLVPAADGVARHSVAVTMRTPGHDEELALGFLVTEGIVSGIADVASAEPCPGAAGAARGNIVNVTLAPGTRFDPARMSRNVYMSSSCGICGKASLEIIRAVAPRRPEGESRWNTDVLSGLGSLVAASQAVFAKTGGLHAAAVFAPGARLLVVREDVGRHNAVDKVVGALLAAGSIPAADTVLWVSGRASFELVQKALVAGIPFLAAVGAPSSLAVDAAREFGMTLVGFLRDGRMNVYSGADRIRTATA